MENPAESTEVPVEKTPVARKPKKAKTRKGGGPVRPFPAMALEETLKVPQLIKEKNGGNPWPPAELAKALDLSAKSNKLWYVTSSARDYGLTNGTRDTDKVELAALGRSIVYAPSREEEVSGIRSAFFNVEVFKKVYDYYKGGELPELKYLENTLESEFKVAPSYHAEFHKIFGANRNYLSSFGSIAPEGIPLPNSGDHAIVVGQPAKKSGLKAFVVMPFTEKTGKYAEGFYKEALKNLIIPAGVAAGFNVETARKDGSDIIHATIINELLDADLVIADLSDHNPNVLFELGVRLAFDKPTALIRAEGTGPIFDVDHLLRVLEYNPRLWASTIEKDLPALTSHIKAAWDARENKKTYMKILRGQVSA